MIKTYIALTVLGGSAALLTAGHQVIRDFRPLFVALAALTALASLFPVHLPGGRRGETGPTLNAGHFLIFSSLLYLGPAHFVLLTGVFYLSTGLREHFSYGGSRNLPFLILSRPAAAFPGGLAFAAIAGPTAGGGAILAADLKLLLGTVCASVAFSTATILLKPPIRREARRPFPFRQYPGQAAATLTAAMAALAVHAVFSVSQLPAAATIVTLTAVFFSLQEINQIQVRELRHEADESNQLFRSAIETLALAVDARDQIGHGHPFRVRALSQQLAIHCGVRNDYDLQGLGIAALLHDLGKLAMPDYILSKRGALTRAEMETVEAHAAIGADILSSVPFPYPVLPFIRHHHEKWNGKGYPDSLTKNEIPLGARILAVADCYDSMRSDRPYRSGLSRQATLAYLQSEAGKSFDPLVVDKLVEHIDELDSLAAQASRDHLSPVSADASAQLRGQSAQSVFQDIASAHREVQVIHEISRSVGRLLNVSETLSLLAERMESIVSCDGCAIFLARLHDETMIPFHTSGSAGPDLNALQIAIGRGVIGWVAHHNRPLVNVSPTPDFIQDSNSALLFKSCLAAPLLRDANFVGVVSLFSVKENAFQPGDLRLVTKVAQHGASAIRNAVVYENTRKHAFTDSLTGLPNLRYFKTFADQELRRAERFGYPVGIIMMDLDSFKDINDRFGHQAGDHVLVHVARMLQNEMRQSDTCIRYGGDEFIGILPGADRRAASIIIDKIQNTATDTPVEIGNGRRIPIGVSIGVASFPSDSKDLDQLLIMADQRMYKNKTARAARRQTVDPVAARPNA